MAKFDEKDIPFQDSTLETIDTAIFNWLKNLDLHTTTNEGFKPVDVIWVSAERAKISKRSKESRDGAGTLKYPLISIERISERKDPARKGTAWGNVPAEGDHKGGSAAITIAKRIKQDKTQNFTNAATKARFGQYTFPSKKKKTVYEIMSIPMPVYMEMVYTIKIRTRYQQQMNDLVVPFMTKTGGINYFTVRNEGHRYECFIQEDFEHNNNTNNLGEEERKYETSVSIRVLGYITSMGKNQIQPKVVIRENAVEMKMPREKIVFGDYPNFTDKQSYVGATGFNRYDVANLSGST